MRAQVTQLILGLAIGATSGHAQTTAAVDINTAQATPLNAGFSGFNYEGVVPYEPYDYRFNAVAAQLWPGWVRYPSGIASDAFDWHTGLMVPAWVAQFQSTNFATSLSQSVGWVAGKGGHEFLDVGRQALLLGAKIIVCANGFTDSPESAGQMAAFAKANNIPVAVWELSNEPYLFVPQFFQSGADYAARMKPYRDAIKAADPNAIVALFFSDPGRPDPAWDSSLAGYSDKYWDAITYHHYGAQSTGGFNQWMTDENANLYSDSAAYVTSHVAPLNPPGVRYAISEFNPTGGDLGNSPSLTNGTLYGAIYAAEYTMRMSTVPSMLYVGMHALASTYGVDANDRHFNDVESAYEAGTSIDTATLDFGFFPSAQAVGVSILNSVLRNAVQVDATAVTGGATVAATGLGQIPALYAQAYTSKWGNQSVLITNKSVTAHQVTVRLNGSVAAGVLPIQYISGTDPSTTNDSTTQSPIFVQFMSSANPIPVPPYSVVRVDLNGGVTIQTSPTGLSFSVDGGVAQVAPATLNLAAGNHTIAVAPTQPGAAGTQYAFAAWSDGGPASHSIAVSAAATTYTAEFTPQYLLSTAVTPTGAGSVAASPSGTYYNAGASVQLTASPKAGYQFGNWTGDLTGGTNPQSIIMNAPHSATASFTAASPSCSISLSAASVSLPATGTSTVETCPNNSGQPNCGVTPETPRSFTVTPGAGCGPWTTTSSNPAILQVTSGTGGSGPGKVSFTLLNNTHTTPQSYAITVAASGATATYSVIGAGSANSQVYREVYALYEQLLGRDPDPAGFAFWTGSGGAGLGQMADSFLTSPEAFNSDFVAMATYQAATGSAPTYAQFTAAVAGIRGGQTVASLFRSLTAAGFSANDLYENLLNRPPTAAETSSASQAGLASWFETMIGYPNSATPVNTPDNEFQSTGTYRVDHTNPLYVAMLYYAILGRDPDAGGLAYWTGIANSGGPGLLFQGSAGYATRLQILGPGTPNQGFIGSPEFQGLFAN